MGNCCGLRNKSEDNSFNSHQAINIESKQVQSRTGDSSLLSTKELVKSEKCTLKSLPSSVPEVGNLSSPRLKSFGYNDLKIATRNFRPESQIGEGGFGYVYKGWIDEQTHGAARPGHGTAVAVKKLKPEGYQGHKEWLSEVNYLGKLHHPNLVNLIGYCLQGENQLLVYEYMPKGSLENHLFRKGAQPLPWAVRIKIAIGAAHGLSFLHESEQPIIYRDFKASNILLDSDFNAKLSDFGLAKEGPSGDHTHVTTQVLGTQGYAAPEYIATGRLTTRCDVYSFGVVLLELLTGRHAMDKTKAGVEQNLVEWARPYLGDKRKVFRIMDTKLGGQYPQKGAFMLSLLAIQCLSDAKQRPQMAEVVCLLESLSTAKNRSNHSQVKYQRHSSPAPTSIS